MSDETVMLSARIPKTLLVSIDEQAAVEKKTRTETIRELLEFALQALEEGAPEPEPPPKPPKIRMSRNAYGREVPEKPKEKRR